MKKKISFIVPLHKFDDTVEKYFSNAIKSVMFLKESKECAEVIIVGVNEITSKAEETMNKLGFKLPYKIVPFDKSSDAFQQMRMGVLACTTEYFTILEFDDMVNPFYITEFEKFSEEVPDASVYMPIVEFIDTEERFCGFGNEIGWASSFSDELGYITEEALKAYVDFNVTGSIIKTEDCVLAGTFKSSLKIASMYEFLLRMVKQGYKIYVIPKAGYVHLVGREDSYMKTVTNTISKEEAQWLIQKAVEESDFKEEREINFVPQTNTKGQDVE
jgi:hypothetical protein